MKNNVWGVKIYTKTVTEGGNREMWGVIEAPIHLELCVTAKFDPTSHTNMLRS